MSTFQSEVKARLKSMFTKLEGMVDAEVEAKLYHKFVRYSDEERNGNPRDSHREQIKTQLNHFLEGQVEEYCDAANKREDEGVMNMFSSSDRFWDFIKHWSQGGDADELQDLPEWSLSDESKEVQDYVKERMVEAKQDDRTTHASVTSWLRDREGDSKETTEVDFVKEFGEDWLFKALGAGSIQYVTKRYKESPPRTDFRIKLGPKY